MDLAIKQPTKRLPLEKASGKTKQTGLPLRVYHDWQPEYGLPAGFIAEDESVQQMQWLFSSANPWFQLGKCTIILSDANAETPFRLVVFIHPQVRFYQPNTGYFGFWRTGNDSKINQQAFQLASQWLKHQKSQRLIGPINFNSFGQYRLQLDDFDGKHFPGEPVNFAYHPQLLIDSGFNQKPEYLYVSQFADLADKPPADFVDKLKQLDKKLQLQYQLEVLSEKVWIEQSADFYQITEMVFSNNPAYQHIDAKSFHQLVTLPLAKRFCRYCSMIVRDKSNQKIVASYLIFPDWSELTESQQQEPAKKLLDSIDFDEDFPKLTRPVAIIKTAGTLTECRGKGLMSWMNLSAAFKMHQHYQGIIGALASANNPSLKLVPRMVDSDSSTGNNTGNTIRERYYGLFNKKL